MERCNDDQYYFATTAAEGFCHFVLLVTDQDPHSIFFKYIYILKAHSNYLLPLGSYSSQSAFFLVRSCTLLHETRGIKSMTCLYLPAPKPPCFWSIHVQARSKRLQVCAPVKLCVLLFNLWCTIFLFHFIEIKCFFSISFFNVWFSAKNRCMLATLIAGTWFELDLTPPVLFVSL